MDTVSCTRNKLSFAVDLLPFNWWPTTPSPPLCRPSVLVAWKRRSGKGVRLNYYVRLASSTTNSSSNKVDRGSSVNDIIIVLFSIKFRLINIDTQRYFFRGAPHGMETSTTRLHLENLLLAFVRSGIMNGRAGWQGKRIRRGRGRRGSRAGKRGVSG